MNVFSLHDLLGFALMAGLGGVLCIANWRTPDRLAGVLLGALLGCAALACLLMYVMDNVVPEGTDAEAVRSGAYWTAELLRLAYAAGFLAMSIQLHFTVVFCRSRGRLARNVVWVYIVLLGMIPAIWLPSFMQARSEPVARTSSWLCAVPWMPMVSPLSHLFVAAWLVVQFYTQLMLWRYRRRQGDPLRLGLRASIIQLVLVTLAGGVAISPVNAWLGYVGPDPLPVVSLMAGAVLILAMRAGRRERIAVRLRRESVAAPAGPRDTQPTQPVDPG